MKKVVCSMFALMLFTLALNGAVWAQSFDHKVRAVIPFSFYAGDKILPAGTYTFGFNMGNHSLMIVNNQSADGALLMGTPADSKQDGSPVLVFRANDAETYTLQSLKATDFALDFNSKRNVSALAKAGPGRSTTVTGTP